MSKQNFIISSVAGIVVTKKGSKPVESAKVTKSLEEALADVQLEWIEE
jgi:tRNA C32,U32 (ribose-2'-O)-methylase TrmJ